MALATVQEGIEMWEGGWRVGGGGECGKNKLMHCHNSAVNFSYRTAPHTNPLPCTPNQLKHTSPSFVFIYLFKTSWGTFVMYIMQSVCGVKKILLTVRVYHRERI